MEERKGHPIAIPKWTFSLYKFALAVILDADLGWSLQQ